MIYIQSHIHLNPLNTSNRDAFHMLCKDEAIGKTMRFETCQTTEEADAVFEKYLRDSTWAIYIHGTMQGVFALREDRGDYYLSAFLSPQYWNQGIMNHILNIMVPYAKQTLHAKNLLAYVLETNIGSRIILEKHHFRALDCFSVEDHRKVYLYQYQP